MLAEVVLAVVNRQCRQPVSLPTGNGSKTINKLTKWQCHLPWNGHLGFLDEMSEWEKATLVIHSGQSQFNNRTGNFKQWLSALSLSLQTTIAAPHRRVSLLHKHPLMHNVIYPVENQINPLTPAWVQHIISLLQSALVLVVFADDWQSLALASSVHFTTHTLDLWPTQWPVINTFPVHKSALLAQLALMVTKHLLFPRRAHHQTATSTNTNTDSTPRSTGRPSALLPAHLTAVVSCS